MIAAVREFANRFLGRGEATITVPSFDGALKPNQKLEAAETLLDLLRGLVAERDVAAVVSSHDPAVIARGSRVIRLRDGAVVEA